MFNTLGLGANGDWGDVKLEASYRYKLTNGESADVRWNVNGSITATETISGTGTYTNYATLSHPLPNVGTANALRIYPEARVTAGTLTFGNATVSLTRGPTM